MRALFTSLILTLLCAAQASAQWVLDTEDVVINGATSCAAGTGFIRTFDVGTAGTVADVDLGLDANHTWRGDIRARLTAPNGTTVQVLTPNTGGAGDLNNYRIRLDDSAAVLVNTGTHAVDTPATNARYSDRVRPSNPLAAFNGGPANGTWQLEICDAFPAQDNGTLLQTTLFITPTALPQAPALSCTVDQPLPFVWAAPGGAPNGWDPGTLINGYSVGTAPDDIPFSVNVTGDTGSLIQRNLIDTPVTSTELSGSGAHAVLFNADFATRTQTITVTVNLGMPGTGVEAAQFTLQDVDKNTWTDRVTVAGSLSGASVAPQLTPGLANRINGASVDGTALTPSGMTESEAVVSFLAPVDQIVLTYTNAPGLPANPISQVMGFFADMSLCPIPLTELTAVKSVELPGANGAELFMVPGQDVIYKITVTHEDGSNQNATDVDISDTLPPTLQFVSASFTGFTSGTFANQNCPAGACVVNFEDGVLPPGITGEIRVTATIR